MAHDIEVAGRFLSGKTLVGWGVVRGNPWHFDGLQPSREAAISRARELGGEYEFHWGHNQDGTDNFIWNETNN